MQVKNRFMNNNIVQKVSVFIALELSFRYNIDMTEALNGKGRIVTDILKLQPNQELVLQFEMGRRGRLETRRITVDCVKLALPGDRLGPSITFTVENDGTMPARSRPQRWTLRAGEMKEMTLIDLNETESA